MSISKGRLAVLLKRELLTMYVTAFLQLSTVMISFTLIPLYIREAGGGSFDVGLQTTLFTLFSVVFRLFLGPMADRRGRKLSLLIGSVVFATAPVGIWLSPSLGFMAMVRIYQAIGMATFLSAGTSYVADHAPPEYRGTSIGLYRTAITLSVMISPAVGMMLINRYGYDLFFIYMTGLGTLGTILAFTLPGKIGERSGAKDIGIRELFTLFRIPALRVTYGEIFALSMAVGILLTFLTGYAYSFEIIRNPALYFTIHAAAGALGAALLGWLSDRYGRDRLLVPVILALSAGSFALVFMQGNPLLSYYLSAVLTGIGYAGGLALLVAKVVDSVPERMRASALAFQESAIDGGNALGIFLFGAALSFYSYGVLFAVVALFVLIIPVVNFLVAGTGKKGIVRG
jgi:MFS family permease